MTAIAVDSKTLWDIASERAALSGNRRMLADLYGAEMTFGEVIARAEQVAAGLYALGIGPGTRVSWQMPTCPDAVVLMLALARLGAWQNPLVTVYRAREISSVLDQFQPSLFIVIPEWRGFDHAAMVHELVAERRDVNGAPINVLALSEPLPVGDPATLPPPPSSAEDVRWVYTTSGTTAQPKCARHRDRSLIAAGEAMVHIGSLTEADIGSVAFPIPHIGGIMALSGYLIAGVSFLLIDPFVPDVAAAAMKAHGVTQAGGGTAHYIAMINEQRKNPDLPIVPTLRAMIAGGGPKPPDVFFDLRDLVHARAVHGLGMTECPYLTSGVYTDTDEQLAYTDGLPLPGNEIILRDGDGNVVPAGEVGEIYVRSPMLCDGYLDAEMTAAAFTADGFYRTGDLGRFRDDGRLQVTGRVKDVIIRKGENISALDVELVVREFPGIADVAIIGVPDVDRGERVCAVVELSPGATAPTLVALREHCVARGLMTQKIPEQLEVLEALPRNAFLKVMKPELRKIFC
ncbi:MAG: class I adenylate-forming enzyme family protein [Acidimicrobiia bacterium]